MRNRWMLRMGLLLAGFCAYAAADASDYAPQPADTLPRMLDISWSRGPDLPRGFQDSHGGLIGETLITAGGFCAGHHNDRKPGRYPRGFMRDVWALELDNEAAGWATLPDFPGAARQGLQAASVGGALHLWGGFSYSAPFCYTDGYRLSRDGAVWRWDPLPDLPWPLCGGGAVALGSKIYLFGGADYDETAFYTDTDRDGGHERLGARLLVFDTDNPGDGWQRLPDCPGTPRWVAAVTAVGDTLYVIGGATGDPYATVIDNWAYDPANATWTRLRDLPVASGNFPAGRIVFADRYILLCGGHQYAQVRNPDGSTRPPYGVAGRFEDKGDYHNDMFVYDTRTGLFGRADSMPLNNNLPFTVVHEDTVYLIGGETGGGVVEGEFYGHHPELCLKGKIRAR